ncbi:YicC family protein [Bacillus sp. V3B]|uniref:YicC/YloC family endoribonuclease n=1 Tax=Bacillus sp. V3B TaxID=2804915 RepID=UPI00210CA78D|nr:YicC/YloC family endoribonuclease [Bacillus sp. V3B]MCQ6274037.1 YicC family protein [Bacillus sp. V3B]
MVTSMTGFGRSKKGTDSFLVSVEVKTVNHRFSEFYIRMPRQFNPIEDKIKKKLSSSIHRGRIEVYVTVEGEGMVQRKVSVDWDLLDHYVKSIEKIQQKYVLEHGLSLQDLLSSEDIIHIEEDETSNEGLERIILEAVEEATLSVKQMREMEGYALGKDVSSRLQRFQDVVIDLQKRAPIVVNMYKERLSKRIDEFVGGQVDEARILTEVAIFADKADINEELTRLNSHIKQFEKILTLADPIGRKLDFLLQEMNREVNTIGSKANDSEIAKEVVEMKSILEKMKEQVQNIE